MDVVDDVLIVSVERDCDCLCLGENKASKQKRLGEKANKATSWKGKEPANPSRRTAVRKSATVLLSSVQSSKPAVDSDTHTESSKDSTAINQGQAEGSGAPDAMQFYRAADQGKLAVASLDLSQPVARGASASNACGLTGVQQLRQQSALAGLTTNQDLSGSAPMMGNSSSDYLDFNADWMPLSASEWDSILGGDTISLGTDGQKVPPIPPSSSSSSSSPQKANTGGQDSAMCVNPTSSYGALASTSAGCNSWTQSGQDSLDSVSSSAAAPVVSSAAAVFNLSGFANYKKTEKDSTIHSVCSNTLATHTLNSFSDSNPSFSANCPDNSSAAVPLSLNQNHTPPSFHPLPSTPSSSLSSLLSATPATSTTNQPGQIQIQQPPSNSSHAQQSDNASPPLTIPNQYQSPMASQVYLTQQQQQQQSVASSLPGQLAPASMSQMAISQMSTPGPVNSANSGTSTSQYPRFAPQQVFNSSVQGPIASWSQNTVLPPQLSYNGNLSAPAPAGREHLHNDETLARKLQEEEFIKGMRRSKHVDERLAMSLLANDLAIGPTQSGVPDFTATHFNRQQQLLRRQSVAQMNTSPFSTLASSTSAASALENAENTVIHSSANNLLGGEQQSQGPTSDVDGGNSITKHPTCWTECPNCPVDAARKYHLIDVELGSPEWDVVSSPLVNAGFSVVRLQRIQNETLWQRLCFEKQLMLRDRPHCNQRFLYHTSRAEVSVICEEGLDPRLSRNGLFGSGIYFSDNPIKCDKYWASKLTSERTMFCCRVLLGDTKVYPKGKSEQLKREPPKEHPLPGQPKTYDSVQGNISGQNEFVVYNAYRVMPEYVIKYSSSSLSQVQPPPFTVCPRRSSVPHSFCFTMRQRHLQLARLRRQRSLGTQLPYPVPYPSSGNIFHFQPSPVVGSPCGTLAPFGTPTPFNNCYPGPGGATVGVPLDTYRTFNNAPPMMMAQSSFVSQPQSLAIPVYFPDPSKTN